MGHDQGIIISGIMDEHNTIINTMTAKESEKNDNGNEYDKMDQKEKEIDMEIEMEQSGLEDLIVLNGLRKSRRATCEPSWMHDFVKGKKETVTSRL